MLEFHVLGPLEVIKDGRSLPLGGQKRRMLLGALLVHHGRVVSADRLVYYLWGEKAPPAAMPALHNQVAQLRQMLGPEVIVTRKPGYALQVDPEQIDACKFERLVIAARQAEPPKRRKLLDEAIVLWRGSPYADLEDEEFVQGERRSLTELHFEAREMRVAANLDEGRGAESVAILERLVAEEPLREGLREQLMLALFQAGRPGDALAVFRETRRLLAEELGIEPRPSTRALHLRILRQEEGLTSEPVRVDSQLSAIARALTGGRVVVVLGETAAEDAAHGRRAVAEHLARLFKSPPERAGDLTRVAQHVAATEGEGPLHDELHNVFGQEIPPEPVHEALAKLIGKLREAEIAFPLLVTASFGDGLEQALRGAGIEHDVVAYFSGGQRGGKFVHLASDGTATPIDVPNTYAALVPEDRTVVLKVNGHAHGVPSREWDSFVVSEDDHIDYLAHGALTALVPVTLAAKLRTSHFLFLGYALEPWSVRVFVHRLMGRDKPRYRSWAVTERADAFERQLWSGRDIAVIDADPAEHLVAVSDWIGSHGRE